MATKVTLTFLEKGLAYKTGILSVPEACSSCLVPNPTRMRSFFLTTRGVGETRRDWRFKLPLCETCWRDYSILYSYDPEKHDPSYRPGYTIASMLMRVGALLITILGFAIWFLADGNTFQYALLPALVVAAVLLVSSLAISRLAYDTVLKRRLQAEAQGRLGDVLVSSDGPLLTLIFENEGYGKLFRDANRERLIVR
jgi:hypothetical protein